MVQGRCGLTDSGQAVGDAFVRWLHDPLTPSTAPGNTCMAGVRKFERHRDWRTSGIQSSDGCGAVMRIVPLALAFRGEDLLEAARISALVTHAHPNAEEAAMAGAWLVRQVPGDRPLGPRAGCRRPSRRWRGPGAEEAPWLRVCVAPWPGSSGARTGWTRR